MNYSNNNIPFEYFIDDISGASIPASRLCSILERIVARLPLTIIQQEFLHQKGYESLRKFSIGELEIEEFRIQAQLERNTRLKARHIVRSAVREKMSIEYARKAEITNRENAALFAARELKMRQRRKLRELPDCFDLPFIKSEDIALISRILQAVAGGQPLREEDLCWLGTYGIEYWTDKLKKSNHENIARKLSGEWKQTGDIWTAINACSNFRKAELSVEGLAIAKEALNQTAKIKKSRSALLTTGGGAHRDLRNFEDTVRFGAEAHALTPEDFRPCTLLGAVHIEMGAYATGAEWYEKAEARGASRNLIDRELQSILNAAAPDERKKIRKTLKAFDASRYNWL